MGSVAIAVSSVWPSRSLRSSSDRKLRMIGSWKDPAFGSDCSGGLCTGTSVWPSGHERSKFRYRRKWPSGVRSEEHTSELQSLTNLVCRLLLEKKKHIR